MADSTVAAKEKERPRNLVAYWFLGLCNNFAYVIMLSAASDILAEEYSHSASRTWEAASANNTRECNTISAGTLLLADVLASLLVTVTVPFLLSFVRLRVAIIIAINSSSFLLVALGTARWQAILGVGFASLSSGLGEVTLLQHSTRYHKNTVAAWASGTGAAGLVGSLLYAGLTSAGLPPETVLEIMLFVPLTMAVSFFVVLESKPKDAAVLTGVEPSKATPPAVKLDARGKLKALPKAFRYMAPLGLTFFFEYFINQGVTELIQFDGIFIDTASQYRWFQFDYRLGVFVARSVANIVRVDHIWALAFLQFLNAVILSTEAAFFYMPSIWIVFAVVLFEGLIAGSSYVSTVLRISEEVPGEEKSFVLGTMYLAATVGIGASGVAAIPFHNFICSLPKPGAV